MANPKMDDLKAERDKLAIAMADGDADAFAGSRAYMEYTKAGLALQAFDDAHPEVIAEIRAAESERILGGKDILGM